jgi:hypothetical protein
MTGRDPQKTITGGTEQFTPKLAYLATVYTKHEGGMEAAFIEAAKIAGRLFAAGIPTFSPIAHAYPFVRYADLDPLDYASWQPIQERLMDACDALIVAHMTGWQESVGIAHEIGYFESSKKPIFDLDPETLLMVKRREDQDPRMLLTIKDMPKYPGKLGALIGETRNHFADGHFEHRFELGGKRGGE